MEMLHQRLVAEFIVKIPGIQRIYGDIHPVFQIIHINAADHQSLIANDFRRCVFIDLIHQFPALVHLSDIAFAGADVSNADSEMIFHVDNTHEIIILRIVDAGGIQVGAGCNHPDNLTFYHSFGCLRIFHLFADGNLVSFGNQSVDIVLCGMEGNTAHRRALLQTAVLACKRNFKFFCYC